MDQYTLGALIIVFAGSIPCGLLGYLIGIKQQRNLISGWDKAKVSSPELYAKLVGYSLIILAVGLSILAFLWWQKSLSEVTLTLFLLLLSALSLLAVIYGNKKYGTGSKE